MYLSICYLMSIGAFVCWILILIKMFQHGATGIAVASIVLYLCLTFGQLIAFVYGWSKAKEWGTQNIMTAWSVFLAIIVFFGGLHALTHVGAF